MQKTEKHCKNQCFCYHKTTKISPKTCPKTQKLQKKMLQIKKLRSKSWKTRGLFTFRLPILDGRVHEQVSSVLFFTVFFEGERHDLSKTGGFGRKMPPPGKPVTFYECHPDDHAPAPSVRADLYYIIVKVAFEDLPIFSNTHLPSVLQPFQSQAHGDGTSNEAQSCLHCRRRWSTQTLHPILTIVGI